jgi:hypothetical protein
VVKGTIVIDTEVIDCGCLLRREIVDGVRNLAYIPCRKNCVNYINAIQMAQSKNLPISKRPMP